MYLIRSVFLHKNQTVDQRSTYMIRREGGAGAARSGGPPGGAGVRASQGVQPLERSATPFGCFWKKMEGRGWFRGYSKGLFRV
jgi:hypothetical protein